MPLGADLIAELPEPVLNELAILEDRAIRAERLLDNMRDRNRELRAEAIHLRDVIGEVELLAQEFQKRAQRLAGEAEQDAQAVEKRLRHLLVLQAR